MEAGSLKITDNIFIGHEWLSLFGVFPSREQWKGLRHFLPEQDKKPSPVHEFSMAITQSTKVFMSCECLVQCVDVVLRDRLVNIVGRWMVGLEDLRGLFQP